MGEAMLLANPLVVGGLAVLLAIEAVKLGGAVLRWLPSRRNGNGNGLARDWHQTVEEMIGVLRVDMRQDAERIHERIDKHYAAQAAVNAQLASSLTVLVGEVGQLKGAVEALRQR